MNFESIVDTIGVYLASVVVGFVSGLLPLVNLEVFLLLLSPTLAKPALAPVAILAAASQVAAKSIVFYAGRGIVTLTMDKYQRKINAVQKKFIEWENKAEVLIFMSAVFGLPPLYLVSFAAGALTLHFLKFFLVALAGRCIRFAAIVYFPHAIHEYI